MRTTRWLVTPCLAFGLLQAGCSGMSVDDKPKATDRAADKADPADKGATDKVPGEPTKPEQEVKTKSGLRYVDLKKGTGTEAKDGSTITVHYTGWLKNGKKFDSSYKRGEPTTFTLGEVIPGWNEGIPGMKVGGKRKLFIPSELGYGARGTPDGAIPPNADLIFEVELLQVK